MRKLIRAVFALLIPAGVLLAVPSSASTDGSDSPSFTLNKERVILDERSGTHIRVKLDTRPDAWVKVTVSTPDTSVFMLPGAANDTETDDDTNLVLWFNRHDWDEWQNAYVWAVQDDDRIDELEQITFSADGHDDATADVVVLETQHDTGTPRITSLETHGTGVTVTWSTSDQSGWANVYRRNISAGETGFTYVGSRAIGTFNFVIDTSATTGVNLYRMGEDYPTTDSYSRTLAVYRPPFGGA